MDYEDDSLVPHAARQVFGRPGLDDKLFSNPED